MRAMVLESPSQPLVRKDMPRPVPQPDQVLVRVAACAVCRTDLHVLDGELPEPKLPLILGHEIVGRVEEIGAEVRGFEVGQRVGIPWLGWTCGECAFCLTKRENSVCARVSPATRSTAATRNTPWRTRGFCFPIPDAYEDVDRRALVMRGLDRLSMSAQSRRREAAWDLWLRRGGAHHRAGRATPGSRDLRVHQLRVT